MCPAGTDVTSGSELHWPVTNGGTTAALPCPQGAAGNVTRTCVQWPGRAFWEKPDVNGCVNIGLHRLWETVSLDFYVCDMMVGGWLFTIEKLSN